MTEKEIAQFNGRLGRKFYFRDLKLPSIKPSKKLLQEIHDQQFLTNPKTNQKFEVRLLNWPSQKNLANTKSLIYPLPWAAYFKYPPIEYAMKATACYYRSPILIMATLGAAQSSKLNSHQHKKITKQNNFDALSEAILETILPLGFKHVHLAGYSMGASVATSMAAHAHRFGIKVGRLVIAEPTGLLDLSIKDMWDLLTKGDREDMFGYIDSRGELRFTKNRLKRMGIKLKNHAYLLKRAKAHLVTYPRAIAAQNLAKNLVDAFKHQKNFSAAITLATDSSISPFWASKYILHELKSHNINKGYIIDEVPDVAHTVKDNNAKFCWLLSYYMKQKI